MHEHEKAYQQNPAQRFYQKHKNPKIKKTKNKNLGLKCMKCMKTKKKKRLRAHTKGLKLGLGRNLEGMKDFSEKERFGSREKREREREREIKIFE